MARVINKTYTTATMNAANVADWKQDVTTTRTINGATTNIRPHRISFYNSTGQPIEVLIITTDEELTDYAACSTYADTVNAIGWQMIPAGVYIEDRDDPILAVAVKKLEGGTNTGSNLRIDFKNYAPVL